MIFCPNNRCFQRLHGIIAAFLLGSSMIAAGAPLEKLENCTLVPTDWADGDSFRIRSARGDEHTVRLYGADCIEWHVNDATDERRLREQRRYFGITHVASDPREAIVIAKAYGEKAAQETVAMLSSTFTVYTAFADARGDGRHPRIYCFVVTHDGKDLAEHLVSKGMARAFGVYRETYSGMSRDDYRQHLADLELQAAKRGAGVWSRTDWESLPRERAEQRQEKAETQLAFDGQPLGEGVKVDPNTAARDELMKLPGVGEAVANRIIEGRPYKTPEDLLRVSGIGAATLGKITPYLEFKSVPSTGSPTD